jgi:hypothetical protein
VRLAALQYNSRYNNGPRTLPWGTPVPALTDDLICTGFQPLRGSVCYVNRILRKGNNSEGGTVLTCTEVQYAILCRMLERCLKMLRAVLLVFEGFVYPLHDSVRLLKQVDFFFGDVTFGYELNLYVFLGEICL